MECNFHSVPRLALGVFLAASSVGFLGGATLERLTLEEMVDKSTAIVRGRIGGSNTFAKGSMLYTSFQVQVLEQWKGQPLATIAVASPGGVSGAVRQYYPGVPRLVEGREYVLFLWTGPSGVTQVIGFTQGVFALPKNASGEVMAVRTPSTETLLDSRTGHVVRDERLSMRLRDLSARISTHLGRGSSR